MLVGIRSAQQRRGTMAKRGFGGLKASLRRLSGANLRAIGSGRQSLGMTASIAGMFMPPGAGAVVSGLGALYAVTGAVKTYQGHKLMGAADRAVRIEKMRQARSGVAAGAAKRSGRAIQASNRTGGRRVAAATPQGSNGSVKGYYRQQGGKSVFVQGYSRA